MAGFFSRLFGKSEGGGIENRGEGEAYKGFTIYATPQRDGDQWRTAGVIVRTMGDEAREHQFIRADVFPSQADAAECAQRKARQIIDERGDRLFDGSENTGHG